MLQPPETMFPKGRQLPLWLPQCWTRVPVRHIQVLRHIMWGRMEGLGPGRWWQIWGRSQARGSCGQEALEYLLPGLLQGIG